MATCVRCKQSHFGMLELKAGLCKNCKLEADLEKEAKKVRKSTLTNRPEISQIVLTTETSGSFQIVSRLGVISSECAFGMHAFKDLFASVRDITGGRSEAIQSTLRDSKDVAFEELREQAFELGANAVIGVQFSYVELSTIGSMVLLVVTGTAVKATNI